MSGSAGTIDRLFSAAVRTAVDAQAPLNSRTVAIRFLTFDDFDRVRRACPTV